MNDQEIAAYLNKHSAYPRTIDGTITAIEFRDSDTPAADHYKLLGLDPDHLGCVKGHPAGTQGGYVPTLHNSEVIFDEDDGWT